MTNEILNYFLLPLSPVLCLVAAALLLIALECVPNSSNSMILAQLKQMTGSLGSFLSLLAVVYLFRTWPSVDISHLQFSESWLTEFHRNYLLDMTSLGFYFGFSLFTFLTLVFSSGYFRDAEIKSEVLILTLFVASGMMLLVSSHSLLMVFLSLELLSLPTYVLVGIHRRDKASCEAALKYFLFGSFASVLLIFGIGLLYAQAGTLDMGRLAEWMKSPTAQESPMVLASLALLLIAMGFKVGLAPFHMWVPDAYQGAPAPITGFMGSAVKLAGFGLALRVLGELYLPLAPKWSPIVDVLAVITMFVGNIAALKQENLKRMFAYSSVSHAGYLMLGLTSAAGGNYGPVYYYLVVYGLMFLGFFAILTVIERQTQNTHLLQISGLGFTHPVLAACLALFALSGAGIPPTAGFLAKYFVFLNAVRADKTFLVVLGVISSLIGAYYYLRVVVFLYMKDRKEEWSLKLPSSAAFVGILFCALSMLYFTVMPQRLGLGTLF